MANLEELAARHKGYKGHLTRKLNAAERAIDNIRTVGPSVVIRDELREAQLAVKAAYQKVEDSLMAMAQVCAPEDAAKYFGKIDEEDKRCAKFFQAIVLHLKECEDALKPRPPAAAAPVAPGAAPAGRAKPMTSLKPKSLSRDATPVELTQWIKNFTAYFTASQFQEATILEQQAHFKSAMDSYLISKVDQHVTPATPVLPDPAGTDRSCIEYLRDEFLILKPLFSRRLDYFNYKQQKGQSFTDWYDKLSKKGDEADLPGLSIDDLTAMRMLTGVEDASLKQEFLRSTEKDSKSLLAVAQNYELGQRYVRSMTGPTATAANVNTKTQGAKPKQGKGSNPAQRAQTFFKDGKCFRCGQRIGNDISAHKESCKARDHVCKKCGKTGHFPSVCLSSQPSTGSSTQRPASANVQSQQQRPEEAANQPAAESANTVRT